MPAVGAPRSLKGLAARQVTADEGARSTRAFLFAPPVCAKPKSPETLPNVPEAEREQGSTSEKAKQAVLDEQTRIEDLRWLMGDPRGRRFMWRLLGTTGLFRTTFTGDALTGAFKEGQRNVGIALQDEVVQQCPRGFIEMQKEARTNERRKAS
jgi:hypothetical protein